MYGEEVMVSICCLAYNHELYIRQCLDGFLMQKTTFRFEVLIHDDASTDRTAEIIREYEKKYPDIIKPIYQEENQYSKGIRISHVFQYPRAKGKYIALCEGDDYWIDDQKLQKQFDALEENPNCFFCAHRVYVECFDDEKNNYYLPKGDECKGIISSDVFFDLASNYQIQTSSYFFLNLPEMKNGDYPEFFSVIDVGDTPLMLLFASKSNLYYYDDIMSCYRSGTPNGWTSSFSRSDHYLMRIEMFKEFNKYSEFRFSQKCEKKIQEMEFAMLSSNGDYKSMLSKKYRSLLKQMPNKYRLFIVLSGYLPHVMKVRKHIMSYIHKKKYEVNK